MAKAKMMKVLCSPLAIAPSFHRSIALDVVVDVERTSKVKPGLQGFGLALEGLGSLRGGW